MTKCIRCDQETESGHHGFHTKIKDEDFNVYIEIKDNGECPVDMCVSCVRKELVHWMAITAPSDPLDSDELPEWTWDFKEAAELEGWGISDEHLVVRDDEAEQFTDDEHALRHVAEQAQLGKEPHATAVNIHMRTSWPLEDQTAANIDGWDLFQTGPGHWEIERDDEAEQFETDEDALDFVIRQAEAGSDLHQRALDIHNRFNP